MASWVIIWLILLTLGVLLDLWLLYRLVSLLLEFGLIW